MTCILKTPNMLKQIQKAVGEKTPTKLIIESFQKRNGLIFTSEWTSLGLDVEVFKKKLFENYKNATKYLNDYYYDYKFVFILGHTKRVTKEYKQEDMYADIIDIQSISTMAWNKMVSVCRYISSNITNKYYWPKTGRSSQRQNVYEKQSWKPN